MENLTQRVFRGMVASTEIVASGVGKITFKINEPFSFSVGQYVWIEIPEMKIPDKWGDRRAFSICNTPNAENTISILVRKSDSGYKQSLFSLVDGDGIIIHGPFGSTFVLNEENPKNIFMIAGGVGIAGFLPVLETIKTKSLPVKCFLVFLNKDKESAPVLQELDALGLDKDRFEIKSKYDLFSWSDVAEEYRETGGQQSEWWISGPLGMVNHVYKELTANGVPEADLVFENFYPTHKQSVLSEEIKEQLQNNSLLIPAIQNSITHTIITDVNGIILFANDAVLTNTGYSREEVIGVTPRLWGGMMSADFYKDFWTERLKGKTFVGELVNRRKNGEIYYVNAHITPIFNNKKEVVGFIGTEDDITSIEKLSKAKSDFVSIASHQLRAPLTAINWYVEMMQSGDAGQVNDIQKKYLEEVHKGSTRMVKLVNNLLDISRIEAGRLKIEKEMVDVTILIDDIAKELKPWGTQLNHEIILKMPNSPLPMLSTDKMMLRQVVQNMMVNAIQYSPQSHDVNVSLEKKAEEYIISISDKGIGIPEDAKDRIFEKFFRADNARRIESEGSGIGLYLARSIMDALGGKVWFESPTEYKMVEGKEVGDGTTFHLSLPV